MDITITAYPFRNGKYAITVIPETGTEIRLFEDPFPSSTYVAGWDRFAGEMKIFSTNNVHPIVGYE